MTDLATLQLAVDSTAVKEGTAALDGLTAAGARAEAASLGLRTGVKGAGVEAAAMASAAQASARAAMDQASGLRVAAEAARVNTLAMRETLVVGRELARGNFTRLPGSLTLLAQGIGSQGGLSAYAEALGLIKKVQDAELAEAAAAAAAATAGIESAAKRAAANVLAADTEVALAEAQVRVTAGTTEEALAQTRLATAHASVAVAADEALVAENALAAAMERSSAASSAAAAAAKTTIGTTGGVLIGVAAAATTAVLGFEALKKSVADTGVLQDYANSLGLTKDKLEELKQKTDDFALTWGDVWHGVWKAASDALDQSSAWQRFKDGNESAFKSALEKAVDFAAACDGYVGAAYDTIVNTFKGLAAALGSSFVAAVNAAITQINNLVSAAVSGINFAIAAANKIPGVHIGDVTASKIAPIAPVAPPPPTLSFSQDAAKRTAAAKAQIDHNLGVIYGDIIGAAEERIKKEGGKPARAKKPKKAPADVYDDMSDKLDEEILSAKEKLAGTVQEQAALQLQAITVERDKAIEDAKQKLADKKLTAGEEKKLELQINELADLKAQAVIRAEQTKLLTQAQAAQDQLFGFQTDALKFADEMATTQAEHRKAQLDMLDIAYKQKAYDLQILLSKQKIAGDLAGQALTQAQIAHLPTEEAMQRGVVLRKTQDPLQAWAQSIPHTADEINQALQSIEVKGFDGLSTAITDVVTGTKSLGAAFKDLSTQIVSEIIQMTTKMLIFRALSSAFPGLFNGGGSGGVIDLTGAQFASQFPHFASGGSFIIGGNGGIDNNVLSINGQTAAMVGKGEMVSVYPAGRYPANNNQIGPIEVVIGFGPAPEFAPYVQQAVAQGSAAAVKFSVDHTNKALKQLVRPRLATRR